MRVEYIDREELLELYETGNTVIDKVGVVPLQVIRQNIMDMPAADVAPVVHGRWECNKPCPVCGGDRFDGLDADIWADWQPPYCPNCGAKMDGGDTDADD